MKLKNTPFAARFAALATTGLLLAGAAHAQVAGDINRYITSPGALQTGLLGGPGNFNQSLVASGYASEVYSYFNGATSADDTINTAATTAGSQNGNFFGNNRNASGYDLGSFALQGAPGVDGSVETITSVTLLFYVTGAAITAPDPVITIYSGLNNITGAGAVGSTFSVSQSQVASYFTVDIPASVAFSGFTLADFINRNPQDLVNFGTEDNATIDFQPAYRVNTLYVIPEPSTVLLGGIASLFLLRRRRQG